MSYKALSMEKPLGIIEYWVITSQIKVCSVNTNKKRTM